MLAFAVPAAGGERPPFKASVSPESVVAGSEANLLRFEFTATSAGKGKARINVPAVVEGGPWSTPQSSDPASPGYVAASRRSCDSASVSDVSETPDGSWEITAKARCDKRKKFVLTYGRDPAGVTAATRATRYTFVTEATDGGPFVPVVSQPRVEVTPAAFGSIDSNLSTEESAVLVHQSARATVEATAYDIFGNVRTGDTTSVRLSAGYFPPGDPFNPVVLLSHTGPLVDGKLSADITLPTFETASNRNLTTSVRYLNGAPIEPIQTRAIKLSVVEPDLETAALSGPAVPNDDGEYIGTLDVPNINMQLDPTAIWITGTVVNPDGTTGLSLEATTVGGDEVQGNATVTSVADPTSGQLLPADLDLCDQRVALEPTKCLNSPIVVEGCDYNAKKFGEFEVPGRVPPFQPGPLPCDLGFWNPVEVDDETPAFTTPAVPGFIGVFTRLDDFDCSNQLTWNVETSTCSQ